MEDENGLKNFLPKEFSSPVRGSEIQNLSPDSPLDTTVPARTLETANRPAEAYRRANFLDTTQDSSLGLHNLLEAANSLFDSPMSSDNIGPLNRSLLCSESPPSPPHQSRARPIRGRQPVSSAHVRHQYQPTHAMNHRVYNAGYNNPRQGLYPHVPTSYSQTFGGYHMPPPQFQSLHFVNAPHVGGYRLPPPSHRFPIQRYSPSRSSTPDGNFIGLKPGRECRFCKKNGEAVPSYKSHVLRNPWTGALICPILREHVCEICGATGDNAHTRNYCPSLRSENRHTVAIPICLKNTRRQSDGQLRG